MNQRDGEEKASPDARDKGLTANRTRAYELDRRLSPCFALARLCSSPSPSSSSSSGPFAPSTAASWLNWNVVYSQCPAALPQLTEHPAHTAGAMPVAASGMIIQLFGGLALAELTHCRRSIESL